MHLNHDICQRIVERISDNFVGPVSVTDASARILASTQQTLIGSLHPLAATAIATSEVTVNQDNHCTNISLPLVYADMSVGALVFDRASQLDQQIVHVFKMLAELIIHQMTVIDQLVQQRKVHDRFVYDLLHERLHAAPEVMVQEATILGIDLNIPRVVVVISIKSVVDTLMAHPNIQASLPKIATALRLEQIQTQLLDQAYHALEANSADVFSFIDEHRLVVLAEIEPSKLDLQRQRLQRQIQGFLDMLAHSSGVMTSAGLGRYYHGWQMLTHSYSDAQFALETGTALHGAGQIFGIEDLGLAAFVCSDNQATKAALAQRLLQPILDEPDLLATLQTFLQLKLASSQTAQMLRIHRHTLVYRLDKIAHLTGLDPRDFDAAAQFAAALLLRKLSKF